MVVFIILFVACACATLPPTKTCDRSNIGSVCESSECATGYCTPNNKCHRIFKQRGEPCNGLPCTQNKCDGDGYCIIQNISLSGTPCGNGQCEEGTCNAVGKCQIKRKTPGEVCGKPSPCSTKVCKEDGSCGEVFKSNNTVCRAPTDLCDEPENCTGLSSECPPDSYRPPSAICRPSRGICDKPEYCSGFTSFCGHDVYESKKKICRPKVDGCDNAETCTGTSVDCPEDLRSIKSYGFKCANNGYFCGIESITEITFNKKTASFAGVQMGVLDTVFTLPWPDCLSWCLSETCPDSNTLAFLVMADCGGNSTKDKKWKNGKKVGADGAMQFPFCPFVDSTKNQFTLNARSDMAQWDSVVVKASSSLFGSSVFILSSILILAYV